MNRLLALLFLALFLGSLMGGTGSPLEHSFATHAVLAFLALVLAYHVLTFHYVDAFRAGLFLAFFLFGIVIPFRYSFVFLALSLLALL